MPNISILNINGKTYNIKDSNGNSWRLTASTSGAVSSTRI